MAKEVQRTLAELLEEARKIQAEIESRKADRLKELEFELNGLGYTAIPLGTKTKAKGTKGPAGTAPDEDVIKAWLADNIPKNGIGRDDLLKKYREKFPGSKLRIASPKWAEILKKDKSGNVTLLK